MALAGLSVVPPARSRLAEVAWPPAVRLTAPPTRRHGPPPACAVRSVKLVQPAVKSGPSPVHLAHSANTCPSRVSRSVTLVPGGSETLDQCAPPLTVVHSSGPNANP